MMKSSNCCLLVIRKRFGEGNDFPNYHKELLLLKAMPKHKYLPPVFARPCYQAMLTVFPLCILPPALQPLRSLVSEAAATQGDAERTLNSQPRRFTFEAKDQLVRRRKPLLLFRWSSGLSFFDALNDITFDVLFAAVRDLFSWRLQHCNGFGAHMLEMLV